MKIQVMIVGVGILAVSLAQACFAADKNPPPSVPTSRLSLTTGEGVGVGGGTGDEREARRARLQNELGILNLSGELEGQIDVSGVSPQKTSQITVGRVRASEEFLEELRGWSRGVSRILERERMRALRIVKKRRPCARTGATMTCLKPLIEASERIEDALGAAFASMVVNPDQGGPMTYALVERGLEVADAVLALQPKHLTERYLVARFDVLDQYIQLVSWVERTVDRPYYIDWRYYYRHRFPNCHLEPYACGRFDYRRFQDLYVDFAQKQLGFITNRFLVASSDGPAPVGSPKLVTKLLEMFTGYAADDLSSTLYAYVHADSVMDLVGISEDLLAFNEMMDRSVYEPATVFRQVKTELDCILGAIDYPTQGQSCRWGSVRF